MKTKLNINGKTKHLEHAGGEKLLDTLRNHGYTDVKRGCAEGECGACLILLDGKPVNSCRVFTAAVPEHQITTVKGLGSIQQPHFIQDAFAESGAVQCGFCTPALVLSTYALLQQNPEPSNRDIHKAMDGILCRCTGYIKIIDAVKLAAGKMKPENTENQ
ncbi:MAG: (2Fe-2S)-binding protein [Bacteroidota bacterium]